RLVENGTRIVLALRLLLDDRAAWRLRCRADSSGTARSTTRVPRSCQGFGTGTDRGCTSEAGHLCGRTYSWPANRGNYLKVYAGEMRRRDNLSSEHQPNEA